MLMKQFGRAHEAVASNEGPEYGEIVRDYHPYTLQECHDRIKYELRVIFIPGPPKSVGQEFCERHLHHYYCWVEDYDLYRTLREAWARRKNTPSTKYPAGWGKWSGKEYARSLSIAGGGTRFVTLGKELTSLAEEDPANIVWVRARYCKNANRATVAARDGEVPAVAARGNADDLGNGKAPAVGVRDNANEGN
jgi:hypothetical protein